MLSLNYKYSASQSPFTEVISKWTEWAKSLGFSLFKRHIKQCNKTPTPKLETALTHRWYQTSIFVHLAEPQVTHWFDFWVLLVQNCCRYVPLKICKNLSRLLAAPLKPTSKSYLRHLSIVGLLPIYLVAKSHLSSTLPIPPLSSQFKHLTASGKTAVQLVFARASLKCSVNR